MKKRIAKKIRKREQHAHEQALNATSWGRIKLKLEHLGEAFSELLQTLQEETGVWQQQAQAGLQKGAKAIDDSMSAPLGRVPVLGPVAVRNLHQFATAPSVTPTHADRVA